MNPVPITYDITEEGCWLCTSHNYETTSPVISIDKKPILLSRYFYQTFYKINLSKKDRLWRTCSTLGCVNPEHQIVKSNKIEYTVLDNGCWISKDREGDYPHFERNGKTKQIIHILYEEKYNKLEKGQYLIRTCGQYGCINPDHVQLGKCGGWNKKELKWKEEQRVEYIDSPCWIPTSHKSSNNVRLLLTLPDGQLILAYRYMYEKHVGPIPEGMVIRHKCDQGDCINPSHLEVGTQADNVRDAYARKLMPVGEDRANSKLTNQQALDIFNSDLEANVLADMYNVSASTIDSIKRKKRDCWKSLLKDIAI